MSVQVIMKNRMSGSDVKTRRGGSLLVWIGIACVVLIATVIGLGADENWVSRLLSTSSPEHLTHVIGKRNLDVTITEQGKGPGAENTEIKC